MIEPFLGSIQVAKTVGFVVESGLLRDRVINNGLEQGAWV
jgi:hypothetical protein